MARYKPYDVKQVTLIPVSFPDQILPGSFEYALNEIVDEHIDLGPFEARYQNDETGCLAYDPAILLKIVLFGYYKGLVSSRRLAEACERNIQFKALTADTRAHFTTIADFVATMDQEIAGVFRDVLIYADALGLIGKETFAIDGCKLPSNASKEWSGTHDELKNKQQKYEAAAKKIVARHRGRDAKEKLSPMAEQDNKKLVTYKRKMEKIKSFLKSNSKNIGPSGNERKSNITDPQSAKMSTGHGVIQGYNETTETKQMTIFIGRSEGSEKSPIEKMRRKFDTLFGRFIYNKRIAIVEPVFGNLKNKGMDRFTLRGKHKVNTQWQLFSLVHNLEKIAHMGAA